MFGWAGWMLGLKQDGFHKSEESLKLVCMYKDVNNKKIQVQLSNKVTFIRG